MKPKKFSSVIASTILLLAAILITSLSCSKSSNNSTPITPTPTPTPTGGNTVTINIVGMAFPASTTVKVGNVVSWVNKDGFTHTVTSDDGTTFNSGNLAGGATFNFTAAKAGSYPYHCNIHSSMTATLVVNP